MGERTKLGAGRNLRLTRREDIKQMFEQGRRAADGLMTLYVLAHDNEGRPARVGVAVATRHGNAVRRNRLKRLCREAFRLSRPQLPAHLDYMLVPRPGVQPRLIEIQSSLRRLTERLVQQLANKS